MNCHDVFQQLPLYVAGALPVEEASEVEMHLQQGCEVCQTELDELNAAASLLAESVPEVAPSDRIKENLLARVESEQSKLVPSTVTAQTTTVNEVRWIAILPYLAATLVAVLLGSWYGSRTPSTDGGSTDRPVADANEAKKLWQQRIADAQRTFQPSAIRVASFTDDPVDAQLAAAIYRDRVGKQLHTLVSGVKSSSADKRLWIWLLDRTGAVLGRGQLDQLENALAAGVLSFGDKKNEADVTEIVLSLESSTDPVVPSAEILGRAQRRVSND